MSREIPISNDLPLRKWFEDDGSAPGKHIITWKGKSVQKVARAFTAAKKRAGVGGRKISMYSMRHTFVSLLLHLDVDVKTAAELTGDDEETILRHYAKTMGNKKRDAINKLPPLHPVGAALNLPDKNTAEK